MDSAMHACMRVCAHIYVTIIIKDELMNLRVGGHGRSWRGAGESRNDVNTILTY